MRYAERRLLAALGVSALLHAWWLTQSAPGVRVLRAQAERAQMSVVLSSPVDWLSAASEEQPTVATRTAAVTTPVSATQVKPASAAEPADATPMPEQRPLPQASDPTYYAALNLDVYPKAQATLDLNLRVAGARPGEVRATVLIDETGVVNEVRDLRGIEPHAEAELAARDLLLATRFTPARKDGRIVKAQVVVSLKYGGAAP